jgi:short-subunit dehydrogenase
MRHAYRTALVTGASSGIGESFARLLAAAGCDLVLVARRAERLNDLAAQLRDEHKVDVTVLPADLTTAAGMDAVAARVSGSPGGGTPIELLVNNAGRSARGNFAEQPPEIVEAQISLNVTALARLARAAVGGMLERGHGGILNVSSMAGFGASPGSSVYAATKAFVTSFSEGLQAELAGTGVHVTALCPGLTRTEFHEANNVDVGYLPKLAWLDAGDVARAGLDAVSEGRPVVVPSIQYKLAAGATRVLPRGALRRITRLIRPV